MHRQICKVLIVFILGWGNITKITCAFKKKISCFDVIIYKGFQQCIDSNSIMSHMIADTLKQRIANLFCLGIQIT